MFNMLMTFALHELFTTTLMCAYRHTFDLNISTVMAFFAYTLRHIETECICSYHF